MYTIGDADEAGLHGAGKQGAAQGRRSSRSLELESTKHRASFYDRKSSSLVDSQGRQRKSLELRMPLSLYIARVLHANGADRLHRHSSSKIEMHSIKHVVFLV